MEVTENSSLSALFNNQKFKQTGAGAMQSSFVAALDSTINASNSTEASSKLQASDVIKDDKPQIKEDVSAKDEPKNTDDIKDDTKKDSSPIEGKDDSATQAAEASNSAEKNDTIDKGTASQQQANGAATEAKNVNEMVDEVVGREVSSFKAGSTQNQGGEISTKASQNDSTEITQDQADISKTQISQNIEVSPQVVQVAQTQIPTEVDALTEVATPKSISAEEISAQASSDVAKAAVEVFDLPQDTALQKTAEVKAQEQEISQKIADPSKKIEISVETAQEGFDFSKPKVAAESLQPTKDVDTSSLKAQDINVSQAIKPQVVLAEVAKSAAGGLQATITPAVDITSKAQQNNIAAVGIELSNKASKFNETASTQKMANNDNLKAMSKEVIDQIKVNITKSAVKGVDVIDIKLKPEDLGELSIKIEIKKEDGSVEINIAATNKETLELLQKDAATLQKAFEDAGYKMGENSLSFSEQNQDSKENSQKQARMDFMADALSEQSQEEIIYEGNTALNIKV